MGTPSPQNGGMASDHYEILDRYELTCPACQGDGCVNCRNGFIPVYTLVIGHAGVRCAISGHHKTLGKAFRATNARDLPHVAWCLRCSWQQVHTDVPEAYDLEAEHTA
jgi:hypothetical protein